MDKFELKLKNYYKYNSEYQPEAISGEFVRRLKALESVPEAKRPRRRVVLPVAAAVALAVCLGSVWAWQRFSLPEDTQTPNVTLEEPAAHETNKPSIPVRPETPETKEPSDPMPEAPKHPAPDAPVSMTEPEPGIAVQPTPDGAAPTPPSQTIPAKPERTPSAKPEESTTVKPGEPNPEDPVPVKPDEQTTLKPDEPKPERPEEPSAQTSDTPEPEEPNPAAQGPDPTETPPPEDPPDVDPPEEQPPREDDPPTPYIPSIITLEKDGIGAGYVTEDGKETLVFTLMSTGECLEVDVTGWEDEQSENPQALDPEAAHPAGEETYTSSSVAFGRLIVFHLKRTQSGEVHIGMDVIPLN